jgi:microcystin degradation protein MlrC
VKLVLAQMKHETNTFSPVPTPLARFGHGRETPWEGREAYEEFKGTGTALGAFIDLAERAGAEVVLPVAAQAWPSGRVAQEAYEAIAGKIVAAVAQGCDAVLLDLHGAMVTERCEDGEGELLARIRQAAPRVPIGVAHDMHANLFPAAGRVHWRAGLGHLAAAVVECAGIGVCTSDYAQLEFRRVRRPVYPLDPM